MTGTTVQAGAALVLAVEVPPTVWDVARVESSVTAMLSDRGRQELVRHVGPQLKELTEAAGIPPHEITLIVPDSVAGRQAVGDLAKGFFAPRELNPAVDVIPSVVTSPDLQGRHAGLMTLLPMKDRELFTVEGGHTRVPHPEGLTQDNVIFNGFIESVIGRETDEEVEQRVVKSATQLATLIPSLRCVVIVAYREVLEGLVPLLTGQPYRPRRTWQETFDLRSEEDRAILRDTGPAERRLGLLAALTHYWVRRVGALQLRGELAERIKAARALVRLAEERRAAQELLSSATVEPGAVAAARSLLDQAKARSAARQRVEKSTAPTAEALAEARRVLAETVEPDVDTLAAALRTRLLAEALAATQSGYTSEVAGVDSLRRMLEEEPGRVPVALAHLLQVTGIHIATLATVDAEIRPDAETLAELQRLLDKAGVQADHSRLAESVETMASLQQRLDEVMRFDEEAAEQAQRVLADVKAREQAQRKLALAEALAEDQRLLAESPELDAGELAEAGRTLALAAELEKAERLLAESTEPDAEELAVAQRELAAVQPQLDALEAALREQAAHKRKSEEEVPQLKRSISDVKERVAREYSPWPIPLQSPVELPVLEGTRLIPDRDIPTTGD